MVGLKINRTKTEYTWSEGVAIGRFSVGGEEMEGERRKLYLSRSRSDYEGREGE